jgi:hypothetical protein
MFRPYTLEKATLYWQGGFGGHYKTLRVRDLKITQDEWAQYPHAIKADFVPFRKRNRRGMRQTYQPNLVVVVGWGTPDAPTFMRTRVVGPLSITTDESRATQFDDVHHDRFSTWLETEVKGEHVIAVDLHGYSAHTGQGGTFSDVGANGWAYP